MARKKKGDPVHGWINLYKPAGVVSTHAVSVVKRAFNAQKAGHAGTLDPLADGILPIALGEATKTVPYVQDALKIYEFDAIWGQQRSTDDAEGDVIQSSDARPNQSDIEAALPLFRGDIRQIPPLYSAIKIDGQRAYDLARYGSNPELIEMPERNVYVEQLDLVEAAHDKASFRCLCGKGTYIRSLVRDIALKCDTFGHVGKLTREKVGPFQMENSVSLDVFEVAKQSERPVDLQEHLLPVPYVLDGLPTLMVNDNEAALLKNGQFLTFVSRHDGQRLVDIDLSLDPNHSSIALAVTNDNDPIGLIQVNGVRIKPERLFNL
jgi:tRNA pseudouridine55 synthase